MSGNKQVESRLDRSLRNQIRMPELGKGFDAAVWARIESAESRATNPGAQPHRVLHVSRWLAVSNLIGVAATLAVVLHFALVSFGGIAVPKVDIGMNIPIPVMPEETVARTLAAFGQVLGVVALLFGLSFTSAGRRLRASFF
jgi:hypothetical protein